MHGRAARCTPAEARSGQADPAESEFGGQGLMQSSAVLTPRLAPLRDTPLDMPRLPYTAAESQAGMHLDARDYKGI